MSGLTVALRLTADGSQLVGEIRGSEEALKKLGASSRDAGRQVGEGLGGAETAIGRFGKAAGGLLAAGGAVYALGKVKDAALLVGGALIEAEQQVVKFRAAFGTLGDANLVAREFDYVRSISREMGIELTSAANSYTKLAMASRGTALEGKATQEIFTSVAKASTAMGLSASETEGALLAISQMISKGAVSAEELRGQLGERLPGAFQIAARAMGITTAELGKMLEQGQVIAEDFLPKFARQLETELGGAAAESAKSAARELERLKSGWNEIVQALADAGAANAIGGVLRTIGDAFNATAEQIRIAKAEGQGFFGQLMAGINTPWTTAQQRLDAADRALADPNIGFYDRWSASNERDRAVRELGVLGAAGGYADETSRGAAAGAVQAYTQQKTAADAASKAVEAYASATARLSDAQRKQADQTKELIAFANAVKGLDQDSAEYARARATLTQALANIDEKYKEKKRAVTKEEREAAQAAKSLNDAYLEAIGISSGYVTKLGELQKLRESGRLTEEQYVESVEKLISSTRFAAEATKELADEEKRRFDRLVEEVSGQVTRAETVRDETEKIRQQTAAEEARTARLGASVEAVARLNEEELNRRIQLVEQEAALAAVTPGEEARADALRNQAQALRELRAAQAAGGVKEATVASMQELQRVGENAANQVGQAFAQSIMDGGKSAAQNLKRLFANLVLTPMVNAIAAPISQGITGFLGGGSGAGSALSLASSAANAWSGFSSLGGLLSSAGSYAAAVPGLTSMAAGSQAAMLASQTGVFGSAGLSATAAAGGSTLGASVAAAAPWAAAALLAYSLLAKGGETRAGGGYGYSASGASFGGAGGLSSIWSDEIAGVLGAGQTRFLGGPSGGEIGQVRETVAATVAGINDLFDRLGSTERVDEFWGKLEQSTKGRGGVFAGGTLASGASFGESSWEAATSRTLSAEEAVQAFALDLKQSTIQALQAASDIPAAMRDILTGVDAEALTDEQANAVLASVEAFVALQGAAELLAVPIDSLTAAMISAGGGVDQLAANVAGYYQNFYSEAERTADATAALSEQFAEVGMVMPATRDQFRSIVESLDLTTAEGQSAYGVMMSLQGAFAAIVPAAEATAASIGAMTQAMAAAVDQAAGWPTADDWVRYAEAVADPQVLAATLSRSFGDAWAALDLGDAFPPPTSIEQYKAAIASLDVVARESLPWAEKLDGALNLAPEFARLVQALDGTAAGVEQTVNRLNQAVSTLSNLQSLYTQEEYKQLMAPLLAEQFASIITDGTAMPTTAAAMRTLVESITDPDKKAALAEFVGQWDDFYVSVEKVSTSAVRATKSVNTMASQMQSAMQSVADFVKTLYVGDLAIGSPQEQLDLARAMYESTLAAAPASPEAMGRLAGYASQYAQLGQSYYGASTGGYAELIKAMREALTQLSGARIPGVTTTGSRTEDISRETLSEIRTGNRLARRQLDAAQRAATRPSYAY